MGILEQLIGGLGIGNALGGLRGGAKATQAPFKKHFVVTDGDAAYDTMAEVLAIIGGLAAGSPYIKVWERTTQAQTTARWGFGSPTTPHNQGYMWFASLDSGTGFEVGVLRLVQAKAMETRTWVVAELDDTGLHGTDSTTLTTATPTNINEKIALPEKVDFPQMGEDSMLQLYYRAIAVPAAEDDVGFSIPVTIRQ